MAGSCRSPAAATRSSGTSSASGSSGCPASRAPTPTSRSATYCATPPGGAPAANCLAIAETRLALAEEGGPGLGRILGHPGQDLLAILELDRGGEGGRLERYPHSLLGQLHAERRVEHDFRRLGQGRVHELFLRHDVRDEPVLSRLG